MCCAYDELNKPKLNKTTDKCWNIYRSEFRVIKT